MIKYAKSLSALALMALMSVAGSAGAQGFYGEVGYSALKLESTAGVNTGEFKPGALRGIVGYSLLENLAVEGMVAFGVKDSEISLNGAGTGFRGDLDNSYGIFLKPRIKVAQGLEVFGRFGYLRSKVSGAGVSASDSDLAYGVGLNYSINRVWSVNFDYLNYYDTGSDKASGLTLGVGFKF